MTNLLDIFQVVDVHDFVVSMLVMVVPTVFCLLFWNKSSLVRSPVRLLATMAVLSLFGWAVVVVDCLAGPMPDNGFAIVCALALGWVYPWLLGMPVLLFSCILRVLCSFLGRILRKGGRHDPCTSDRPRWGVVILLVVSQIIYPICLSVKTGERGRAWRGIQCRTNRGRDCVCAGPNGRGGVKIRESGVKGGGI